MSTTSFLSLLASLGIMLIILDPIWIGLTADVDAEALAALAAVIIIGLIGSVAVLINHSDWLLNAPSISVGLMVWVILLIGVGCLLALIAINYQVYQVDRDQKQNRKQSGN